MGTFEGLWNIEEPASEFGVDVPAWIEQDITGNTLAAILQGGCASGAYMPAVTYYQARQVMAEHGDDVLQFLEDYSGELPQPDAGESWSGIAVFYLSCAVETWASVAAQEVIDFDDDDQEGGE